MGTVLRLYGIQSESAWCDEAVTLLYLPADNLHDFMQGIWIPDPHAPITPLYHWIAFAWSQIFGGTMLAMRMMSIVLGLLAIPLLYAIGRRLFNTQAGIYAAYFGALSQVQIYFSQEVRFYSLMTLLALISFYALLRALEDMQARWWVLHGIVNFAMLFVHPFAPIFYGTVGLYLVYQYWRTPRIVFLWGTCHVAFIILRVLHILWLDYDMGEHGILFTGPLPSWREFANAMLLFSGARFTRHNPAEWMPGGISLSLPIGGLIVLLTAWGTYVSFMKRKDCPTHWHSMVMCWMWLLFPLFFLFATSWIWRPVFFYRYVLYAAYAFPWLMGLSLTQIPSQKNLRVGVSALLVALIAYQTFAIPRPLRADYQQMARDINQDGKVPVLALKNLNYYGVLYCLDRDEEQVLNRYGFRELCAESMDRANRGEIFWVSFYYWDNLEDFEVPLRAAGHSVEKHAYAGIPTLYGYRIQGDAKP